MKRRVGRNARKLKPGHFRVGPESMLGCFNTGHAPMVYHIGGTITWIDDGGEVYVVGPELFRHEACVEWINRGSKNRVIYYKRFGETKPRTWTYHFYRTWRSANRAFKKLCDANLASLAEQSKKALALYRETQNADPEMAIAATVALGDML